jgi:hypothetical protein
VLGYQKIMLFCKRTMMPDWDVQNSKDLPTMDWWGEAVNEKQKVSLPTVFLSKHDPLVGKTGSI